MHDLNNDEYACAAWVARFLRARGVDRVFGLQGGHIQPIWDHLARLGVSIIDVRDEGAAVHMAHAHAELTGRLGVALATAGPGVTNTVTGVANAFLSRIPILLIGGCTPRPQDNMGPLQGIPHAEILKPVTRFSRTARVAEQVVRELDEAVARAFGDVGEPGPVYVEIPADVLRQHVPPGLVLDDWMQAKPRRVILPGPASVEAAVNVLWNAKRPLVISGRGARGAERELQRYLDASGAVYLDTQESRGLVPLDHPAVVGAVRAAAMSEADVVFVIGRKLDYQLGFGSPAVFPEARFVRLSDSAGELIDNRRGSVELLASPRPALEALVDAATGRRPTVDGAWTRELRARHCRRVAASSDGGREPMLGEDGKIHPGLIFRTLKQFIEPDCIGIADGGDLLSFARVGLETSTYLDAGVFGCLGVGVPFAIAAALAYPGRQVVSVNGDGAYGINAMEIDTAVRHAAKAVFIVSNNAAWNIERYDQETNYGGRVAGTLLRHSDYAGMARALGAHGETVRKPEDLPAALKRAFANAPAVVDVITSQSAVSSDAKKGLGFVPDYQPLSAWNDAELRRRAAAAGQ